MSRLLLTGNEAFAHAALEAGVGVVAGHPSHDPSEVVETVARQLAKGRAEGVSVEWSTDEKVALELCAAASMSGLRSLFTCQQVGLNVASDALFALNCVGVRGGLVLFVTDDPNTNTAPRWQDTRSFAELARVPIFDPSTPEQGFAMMKQAFDLSESFGTPVVVRSTTRIGQSSAFFEVEDQTEALSPRGGLGDGFASYSGDGSAGFVHDSRRWVLAPQVAGSANVPPVENDRVREVGAAHAEVESRIRKIAHTYSFDSSYAQFNPIEARGGKAPAGDDDERAGSAEDDSAVARADDSRATIGIACGGGAAAVAAEALFMIESLAARAGMELPEYKLIQLGTPYPFPRRAILRFYKGLSDVLVLEELDPFIENELLKASGTSFLGPSVHGKLSGEVSPGAEMSVEAVAMCIARFLDESGGASDDKAKTSSSAGSSTTGSLGSASTDVATTGATSETRRSEGAAEPFGAYSSISGNYGNYDSDFGDIDDGISDDIALGEARDERPSWGESKVKQRLAALQKRMTFVELVEQAIGTDALYEYKGELSERPAMLCAGCPHRASLLAAKNAVSRLGIARNDAIFCGDVGCSTLGVYQPLEAVDTSLVMGSGIAMAQGFAAANPQRTCIAFVGDDSFFASGMTAVANAVWNERNITMIVLDNMTTAACGLQPNPGSGSTLGGREAPSVDIEKVLRALGVGAVYRVDPLYLADAEDVCMRAIEFEGPSAVVMTSPCVCLKRNDKAAAVNVNKCTGCKKCMMETGCPAISLDVDARGAKSSRRGQAFIDTGQCTGCGLCSEVCPFQAIVVRKRGVIETAFAQAKVQAKAQPTVRAHARPAEDAAPDASFDQATSAHPEGREGDDAQDDRIADAHRGDHLGRRDDERAWPEDEQASAPHGEGDAGASGAFDEDALAFDGVDGASCEDESGTRPEDLAAASDAPAPTTSPRRAPQAAPQPSANAASFAGDSAVHDERAAANPSELSLDSIFGGQVKIDLGGGDAS